MKLPKMQGYDNNHPLSVAREVMTCIVWRKRYRGKDTFNIKENYPEYRSWFMFLTCVRKFGVRVTDDTVIDLVGQNLFGIRDKFDETKFMEICEKECNRAVSKGYGMPNDTRFNLLKILSEAEKSGIRLQLEPTPCDKPIDMHKIQAAVVIEEKVSTNVRRFMDCVKDASVFTKYPEWDEVRYKIVIADRFYTDGITDNKVRGVFRDNHLKYFKGCNNAYRQVKGKSFYTYIPLHKYLPEELKWSGVPVLDYHLKFLEKKNGKN